MTEVSAFYELWSQEPGTRFLGPRFDLCTLTLCTIRVRPWQWHMWCSSLREYDTDTRFYLVSPMCDLYLERFIQSRSAKLVTGGSAKWEAFPESWYWSRLRSLCMESCLERLTTKRNNEMKDLQDHGAFVLWAGATWRSDLGLSLIPYSRPYHKWYTRANQCQCVNLSSPYIIWKLHEYLYVA